MKPDVAFYLVLVFCSACSLLQCHAASKKQSDGARVLDFSGFDSNDNRNLIRIVSDVKRGRAVDSSKSSSKSPGCCSCYNTSTNASTGCNQIPTSPVPSDVACSAAGATKCKHQEVSWFLFQARKSLKFRRFSRLDAFAMTLIELLVWYHARSQYAR